MAVKYPHMLPAEVALWEAFLGKYWEYYERFEYDVHVGEGIYIDPAWAPEIQHAARTLTQKRIDAVGYREGEIWLFEVKPDAGLSALGQLLGYKALWERDPTRKRVTHLAVVTDYLNPDEEYFFRGYGIKTYLVRPWS